MPAKEADKDRDTKPKDKDFEMAALTAQQRAECAAEFIRANQLPIDLTKPEILAMIAAIDDLFVANSATFNNALPPAAKNKLIAKQKAHAFAHVFHWRYGKDA